MSKYFQPEDLEIMLALAKPILKARTEIFNQFDIDILDTDAISSLSIWQIVKQYDPNYNINFSRNGEDAQSQGVLIEQKATRISGPLTKQGRPRKNAGRDAVFQFHAMGDLDYPRYIFVARNKTDLSVMRIYDISQPGNRAVVLDHLMDQREQWLERGREDQSKMKRDIISLPEKTLLDQIKFTESDISGCRVFRG